eukprot:397380-Rhodomonas_salina.1
MMRLEGPLAPGHAALPPELEPSLPSLSVIRGPTGSVTSERRRGGTVPTCDHHDDGHYALVPVVVKAH